MQASQNQAQDVATNVDRELDRFDSPQSFKSIQQSEGDPGTAPHVPPADVPPQGGLQGAGPAGVPVTAGTEFTSQDLKEGQGGSGPVWEVAGAEEAGGMGQPQPARYGLCQFRLPRRKVVLGGDVSGTLPS